MFLTRFLIGLALVGLGIMMVWKTQWILSFVGRIQFAEKMFGGGGSRFFYKLLGTAIIIIGFMLITNLFDLIIGGFITRLFSR